MKKTHELRAEARHSVNRRAALSAGDAWFPCMILDMSDNGFQIICSKELAVGQVLDFRCELYPGKQLECKIEVRHASEAGIGTKIVEIDQKGMSLCQLFLQEQYAGQLNKSG